MLLPSDFILQTQPLLGMEWDNFVSALESKPITSIRLNSKCSLSKELDPVLWCPSAYYLPERPNFTSDPLFHAGAYYVQEASSMFLYQALKNYVSTHAVVLDMCAAPGGKSTLISQYLDEDGLLVCNEFMRSRAQILSENIQKWGNHNVIVTSDHTTSFEHLSGMFDAILVDAPCSGEGMFRKDAVALEEWSLANSHNCVIRQKEIITSAWNCLKENGIFIYSTCTFNRAENEENVHWICKELGAEILPIPVDKNWQITETEGGYRFYPHKTKGEGLFLTVLRKNSLSTPRPKPKGKLIQSDSKFAPCSQYLIQSEKFSIFQYKGLIYAFAKQHLELLLVLMEQNYILHLGVALFEQKGTDFIPQTCLAMSKTLHPDTAQKVDLSWTQAIAFLRSETLSLPESPKGFLLVCYEHLPLGWVKNLGTRCNNLYPSPWRIRMPVTTQSIDPKII